MSYSLSDIQTHARIRAHRCDIEGVANCLKVYVKGLRKPREEGVRESALRRVFQQVPADIYRKAVWLLLDDDDIGYVRNGFSSRASHSFVYWGSVR